MPAPGYRSAASAVLGAVGADSHAWASSSFLVGSYTAGNYYGGATRMVPLKDDNRAYGFPVRCVQHLSGPFVSVRHPERMPRCFHGDYIRQYFERQTNQGLRRSSSL